MLTLFCIVLDSLVTIFREEGPAALYKGFVPKVLRLAPGGGVLLLVVEATLGLFRQGACLVFLCCVVYSFRVAFPLSFLVLGRVESSLSNL